MKKALATLALLLGCAAAAAGTFTPTGKMTTVRVAQTATLLPDGRVLVAGGAGSIFTPPSAELYDPATGRFTATGSMILPRAYHSATLLANGKVLIVGGNGNSAELYDPATETFSLTGESRTPKSGNLATALANGKVLIAGDVDAELYDPATGQFEPAGPYGRTLYYINTATSLADGRVLFVGDDPARLYDPASNTFSNTGSLLSANLDSLELHTATLLRNGKVLIAGGMNDEVWPLGRVTTAELYDPATGEFVATAPLRAPRDAHAAVRLDDGKVLIVGGQTANCDDWFRCGRYADGAELYDPSTGTFAPAGVMNFPRTFPTATLLKNGDVLITGGDEGSAELYHPGSTLPTYQGLWWNSPAGSEPGWGVNIIHQGDILLATWLTYDADGNGTWLVMSRGDPVAGSPATYAGALYRTTGPPFDAPSFDPSAVTRTAVGTARFRFTDPDNGTFTYEMDGVARTKAITRMVFSTLPACALGGVPGSNYQDLWWNSPAGSESGWGVNIAHQGDILFATWFTYDSNGRGLWLSMPRAQLRGTGAFVGVLYRTRGPAFSSPTWDAAAVVSAPVGTATFAFSGANTGQFSATVNGVTVTKTITRMVYSTPTTVCY
jgi:hypothetical protein